MKVSVSLPEDDVRFLDDYAEAHQVDSRSAALQRAIRLLRASELSGDYAAAFDEWGDDPANDAWGNVAADT